MKHYLLLPVLTLAASASLVLGQSTRSIPNFAKANLVLGQPGFNGGAGAVSDRAFSNGLVGDIAIDPATRKVFVADSFRVLRFANADALRNGAAAEAVFGQGNFTAVTSPSVPNEFRFSVLGIFVDQNGRLWIADANNRVLRFNNAATLANGADATAVLGQSAFDTNSSDVIASKFLRPSGLAITSDDSLWVADQYNQRVLRFDGASTKANGAAANGVLGQPDFFSNTQNNRSAGNPQGDQGFLFPEYLFVDNVRGGLWVSDSQNRRVLRFGGQPPVPKDVVKPVLKVGEVAKTTQASSVKIRGTASDNVGVKQVRYRIGRGAAKTASGTKTWSFSAKLKKGKNKIEITASDAAGNLSKKRIINIERR